jgi:hypothetical protein
MLKSPHEVTFKTLDDYDGFEEYIDYRYPSNLMQKDRVGLKIVFLGDEPDAMVKGLARQWRGSYV